MKILIIVSSLLMSTLSFAETIVSNGKLEVQYLFSNEVVVLHLSGAAAEEMYKNGNSRAMELPNENLTSNGVRVDGSRKDISKSARCYLTDSRGYECVVRVNLKD